MRQRLGNPRWDETVGSRGGVVYGGDSTTTATMQPRPKSIPYPPELNILPVTYHNLIIIRPKRSGPYSSSIGGFLRQPGVHFRLWPTGPSVMTHVSAGIGYTTINHTLFAPLPGPQTAKSLYLLTFSHIRVIDPRTSLILAAIPFS